MKTTSNKSIRSWFSKGITHGSKFSNILQKPFVQKLSLVRWVRKKKSKRRIYGPDEPLPLSKTGQGGWRGRAQWEKERGHQGEPVFSKGAFQVPSASDSRK